MDLDEVDLNVIYEALHRKVATTTWNVEDDEEFQMLVHIKGLIGRIGEHLDGVHKEIKINLE